MLYSRRETQPKRPRKHTEPTAPAKKLTSAPAQPADMKIALWEPPVSPYFLIEEVLYNDPWKLLVACMLLNKTTGRAVSQFAASCSRQQELLIGVSQQNTSANSKIHPTALGAM